MFVFHLIQRTVTRTKDLDSGLSSSGISEGSGLEETDYMSHVLTKRFCGMQTHHGKFS